MENLYNRALRVYRQLGPSGLTRAIYKRLDLRLMPFYFKSILNKSITLTIGKLKMHFVVDRLTDISALYNTYKREDFIWKYLLRELKPGEICWDAGANIGFYSILASTRQDVNVIAFEPNPTTVTFLRKNVELNRRANIKVINIALSNAEGTAKFDTIRPGSANATAHLTNKGIEGAIDVKTNRGDKVIESGQAPAPDILKMDVEGAEYLVMEGMGNALSKCRLIFCELHAAIENFGNTIDDFFRYLENKGFNIEYREKVPGFSAYYVIARKSK